MAEFYELAPGTLLADRFTVEALAGHGGMGTVYRALDARSGRRVALKLLHAVTSPEAVYRFNREAVLLAELRHPAIVSYVAHGSTRRGQPFLAMAWLEGEDLAQRMRARPLRLPETVALLRRVAEALDFAHRLGIIHRDIKPSNLFLREGRAEDGVVLDFGLARYAMPTLVGVTRRQGAIGSPGYMAPEQASNQPEILPSADIFSLGCVLYECLTGQSPFAAPNFVAALDKLLFSHPAPLHTLRAGLPPGLQVLVDRMLDKDPQRRLPDAASLLTSLSALESIPDLLLPSPQAEAARPGATEPEPRLVSVLRVAMPAAAAQASTEPARERALPDTLHTALRSYGAQEEILADGSLLGVLVLERGTAADQATLAARCALTLKERCPEARVVVATGLGVFQKHLPAGPATERAEGLLGHLAKEPAKEPASASSVLLDDVTAGLLGAGFQVARSARGIFLLQGERGETDGSRALLGRPTPFVGREQEVALLDLTLATCVEEPTARAMLVTAPAGTGKSRLVHEFLHRLEQRGQSGLVLRGCGDPLSVGTPYGVLGQTLRRLCGIDKAESLETSRARLLDRVALHLPGEQAQTVAMFLGELCAVSFSEEDSTPLSAARSDPRLMSAQVTQSLVTFLAAECARGPVLLVLEDLHWSDAPTIKLVDELLRELSEQPLMVLALARPEVKDLFPGLWSRFLQELSLRGLSQKASTRLAQEVLGTRVPPDEVALLVERSTGNALFLEELIRSAAEGSSEQTPGSVLAMLGSSLQRLGPLPRRVLRAASIFGSTFWLGGVKALLQRQLSEEELEQVLRQLVDLEVVQRQSGGRFLREIEYRFRHAIVRDAAFSLVPDSHKASWKQLAGSWLEKAAERSRSPR
ncbi:serine/threonine-protein kinase [Hyalangium sp.]|uniref:serine/threonine-protein kinase n=1 Tax=Hyalangium sp. TaxID=2028555 RepID=UPI002D689F4E|nr:AAA family ATPase [Hyalangium sp.]HYH95586.1 AAA family ATPase [Hyalangium sp.]